MEKPQGHPLTNGSHSSRGFTSSSSVRFFGKMVLCALTCRSLAGAAGGSEMTAPEPGVQQSLSVESSKHIAVTNVNSRFLQNGGSCVLSSYAIVANYFTGEPISSYFEGYCRHFGLKFKDAAEAEQKYAGHFDAEWRKRDCRGYEVILDLHAHSKEKCFADARRVFEGRFYLDSSAHIEELERLLSAQEAFLNITYEPGGDYHSITIMHDGKRFMSRDTTREGVHPIPGLRQIGKLRDSVLYIRKTGTQP